MNNKFTIIVSATDRATQIFRKVNKAVGEVTSPLGKAKTAAAGLAASAGDMTQKLAAVAAPLAAITGAASIAGVAALATEWARLGAAVSRSAAGIGISAVGLQQLQGAAQLAGVSSEGLTNGLKSLGDTMEDALYGRNQEALAMMSQLGLRLHHTADGAVDAERAFGDLAQAISRVKNPQVQGLIARTFGLEEALPLLRKGRAGLAEYRAEAQRLGAVMSPSQVAAAAGFQETLAKMGLAAQGVKNAIGDALIPVLQPLVTDLSNWAAANRGVIATKVAEFASGIASAIRKIDWNKVAAGIGKFVDGVAKAVDWVGGWQNALLLVAAVKFAPLMLAIGEFAAAVVKLTAVTLPGLLGVLGKVGTAMGASGVLGGGGAAAGGGALLAGGAAVAGSAVAIGATGYLAYQAATRTGRYAPGADGKDLGGDPNDQFSNLDSTISDADRARMGKFAPPSAASQAATLPAEQTSSPATDATKSSAVPDAGAAAGSAGGTVQVVVSFVNAPRGMRAETASSGNVKASTRIDYSMPTVVNVP